MARVKKFEHIAAALAPVIGPVIGGSVADVETAGPELGFSPP